MFCTRTSLTPRAARAQIGTTKGTGGDVLILEEAAYCDEGFFYETVAPILSIGSSSLVAISTLTSEINFYTRLIQMVDPGTDRPLFAIRCIELCCEPFRLSTIYLPQCLLLKWVVVKYCGVEVPKLFP